MEFMKYIAAGGEGAALTAEEVGELLKRCEWFSTARIVREHLTGEADGVLAMIMSARSVSSLKRVPVDMSKLLGRKSASSGAVSTDDIIEKFLQRSDYRIVAADDSPEPEEILTEAEFSEEDDLVSEELAEIYLSQGLKSEALAIYRKLSLRNTEKSIYFAEIIDKIENNN